jgi:hypothetical protein
MVRDSVTVMKRLALAIACVTGCKHKLDWSDKKATEIVVGPHKIAIPVGWRDISELNNDELRSKMPAGVVGMMPEKVTNQGFQPNIVFTWTPFSGAVPSCDEFAIEVAKQFQATTDNVKALEIDGDKACRWNIKKDQEAGTQAVRFEPGNQFIVQCLRAAAGDAAADKVCAEVLASLKFPASS